MKKNIGEKIPDWLATAQRQSQLYAASSRASKYSKLPKWIKLAILEEKSSPLTSSVDLYLDGYCSYEDAIEIALMTIIKEKK